MTTTPFNSITMRMAPLVEWGMYNPDQFVCEDPTPPKDSTKRKNRAAQSQTQTEPKQISISIRTKQGSGFFPPHPIPSGFPIAVTQPAKVTDPRTASQLGVGFKLVARVVMDEICATKTVDLGHADWTLNTVANHLTELVAPQSWWSSESGLLAKYFLVQETSSTPQYQGQFTLIKLDDEAAFAAWKIRNMAFNQTTPFKLELHFGIDPIDEAFSEAVWEEKDMECWVGEEAFMSFDDSLTYVTSQHTLPHLKPLTEKQQKAISHKMSVKQPSTKAWFPARPF
ncbi:hypothetical protein LTR70_004959 [Exophiala xenobiotica]|uniref:Uncharacterized protein n=1 Tax=Lithohypha guttulata TaxID=1690604 RepID=A0ABR0JWF0_9EURO|nr:hypothetical protein LTR24_009655 [Lithohypha guttulata]KAK5319340.1 hypothetical protein LTR70_004959 [Exophiala xenobiotica]